MGRTAYCEEIKRVDDLRNKAEGETTYTHIYTVRREELADILTAAKRNSYRFCCGWSKKELKMSILEGGIDIWHLHLGCQDISLFRPFDNIIKFPVSYMLCISVSIHHDSKNRLARDGFCTDSIRGNIGIPRRQDSMYLRPK